MIMTYSAAAVAVVLAAMGHVHAEAFVVLRPLSTAPPTARTTLTMAALAEERWARTARQRGGTAVLRMSYLDQLSSSGSRGGGGGAAVLEEGPIDWSKFKPLASAPAAASPAPAAPAAPAANGAAPAAPFFAATSAAPAAADDAPIDWSKFKAPASPEPQPQPQSPAAVAAPPAPPAIVIEEEEVPPPPAAPKTPSKTPSKPFSGEALKAGKMRSSYLLDVSAASSSATSVAPGSYRLDLTSTGEPGVSTYDATLTSDASGADEEHYTVGMRPAQDAFQGNWKFEQLSLPKSTDTMLSKGGTGELADQPSLSLPQTVFGFSLSLPLVVFLAGTINGLGLLNALPAGTVSGASPAASGGGLAQQIALMRVAQQKAIDQRLQAAQSSSAPKPPPASVTANDDKGPVANVAAAAAQLAKEALDAETAKTDPAAAASKVGAEADNVANKMLAVVSKQQQQQQQTNPSSLSSSDTFAEANPFDPSKWLQSQQLES